MPEVCLVTAPVSTDFEHLAEVRGDRVSSLANAPKLGILTLAGALEVAGHQPSLFDLDEAYLAYLSGRRSGVEGFPAWVARRITATGARLFGFSSLCSSYPVTIRVCEAVKRCDPGCTVLLGGPQASVVDRQTLSAFPFIDFILRGEADLSLFRFLDQWGGAGRFAEVEGLTWRSPFGVQRNLDAPVIDDLDGLPSPAYHLSPGLLKLDYTSIELGRGCPFACTFCSTNDFFRRKFRVKSPARMLADMRWMNSHHGFRKFNLVHDMFTVDRRKVAAFCETLLEAGEPFSWACSARTDCVDEELLALMARAGCHEVFFGVEAGSERMQRIIGKDLDPAQSRAAVETVSRLGMVTTVSLIAGFPEETEDDLRQTVDAFCHALRQPHSRPQLNVLAPLAGTPVWEQHKDSLAYDEIGSFLSSPGWSWSSADRDLIRRHPEIFPNFYLLPTPHLDRPEVQELCEFLPMCALRLRWVLLALHRRCPDFLTTFRAWRSHRRAFRPDLDGGGMRRYYTIEAFAVDFVRFLRRRPAEFGDPALDALLTFEETMADAVAAAPERPSGTLVSGRLGSAHLPVRAHAVHVVELDFDLKRMLNCLQRNEPAVPVPERGAYCTARTRNGDAGLLKVAPAVGRALLLCDGTLSVQDFAASAAPLLECAEGQRPAAARSLLVQLRKAGLIEIYRP